MHTSISDKVAADTVRRTSSTSIKMTRSLRYSLAGIKETSSNRLKLSAPEARIGPSMVAKTK